MMPKTKSISPELIQKVSHDWFGNISQATQVARDEQIPPDWPSPQWTVWLLMAGRGYG